MTELLQLIVGGLAAGCVYALIAVGYSLVYGALELINFAFGDTYMLATFVAFGLLALGSPVALAIAGCIGAGVAVSMLTERIAYRPLRNANRIAPTVSAIGVALVLENVVEYFWGSGTFRFKEILPAGQFVVGGVEIGWVVIVIVGGTAVVSVALAVGLARTGWGRAVRAIRDDLPTAEMLGVNVNRAIVSAYAVGGALGALAGIMFAAYYGVINVSMGFSGTMAAFAAVIIGGIGSLRGAIVGGLLLGVG